MELKFRGLKVSTKITKIKTPRNFQRIRCACPFMCIFGIYEGGSVSFNIGDVVSHEDISDISAASDEAKSLYELDSHSLLDAGILMSILMYYVYVNSIDSIMNATDDSESEDTTNMDTTMDEQCKMIQNNDYSYYLYIDSTPLYFGSSLTSDMAVVSIIVFPSRLSLICYI